MGCVYFTKGFAYATNAHVAIRQSLDWLEFTPEQIKVLEGKFLTAAAFAEVYKAQWIMGVTNDGIECLSKKGVSYIIKFDSPGAMFPDVQRVLDEHLKKDAVPCNKVGFNKSVLTTIMKAAYFEGGSANMYWDIRTPTGGVIIRTAGTTLNDQLVLVMPVHVTENDY